MQPKPKPNLIRKFIALEASSGIVLLLAALAALLMVNSPLAWLHEQIEPAHHFINDGLMVAFFLLVGIEIKRERLEGHLRHRDQYLLPILAALGGVVVPALIFWFINRDYPENLTGWAIPTATDIAFALCIMQLLGKKVPHALRITLVTIAIVDDIIAVAIIALFYAGDLNLPMLAAAGGILSILIACNKLKVKSLFIYLLLGIALWWFVLHSGIHATLAGVALAFCIPPEAAKKLEHSLHPWVSYGIMPLFAFANAGVSLAGISWNMLLNPVTSGIALGLILGKPLGVLLMTLLSAAAGLCKIPHEATKAQYTGMAILCGIGFTMSLFIGGLSFPDSAHDHAMRLGVLAGSAISALLGFALLTILSKKSA